MSLAGGYECGDRWGITPPTPEKKRAATIFIATGLFGTVAGVVGFLGLILHQLIVR